MMAYQLGSHGETVRRIQEALQAKGLYRGPLDGDFGGGTQAAVMGFQRQSALDADGKVGEQTWKALMRNDELPASSLQNESLARLTGAFETGKGAPDCFCGISGDFDGQGISFGVLQWNFGQGSLQPLLREMVSQHHDVAKGIFGEHFDALKTAMALDDSDRGKEELLEFARSIQHPVKHVVFEPWRGYAKALGRTPEFQEIQTKHAQGIFEKSVRLCEEYGLWSERAVALMFDIVTQNGTIKPVTRAQIMGDIAMLDSRLDEDKREVEKLKIVANRRAEAANPRWVDDVRRRKLCIATGEGTVHGIPYHLATQFFIRLVPRQ